MSRLGLRRLVPAALRLNPFPVATATVRRYPVTTGIFIGVIAIAVALGVGISALERSFRQGSAAAAERFNLIVAAPGSQFDIVLSTIFLQPKAVQLLDPSVIAKLISDPRAEYAAPIGFGDNVNGYQVIGTIGPFVANLSGGLITGRMFAAEDEAVVGADVPFLDGDLLQPAHGAENFGAELPVAQEGHHEYTIKVVGRMRRIGNPWDRAVIVPIERIWEAHGLPTGHPDGSPAIGLPFDPARLPGLPALVVKFRTFGAAYALRQAYNTERSMAFFPAEVLLQTYNLIGNVQYFMSLMAWVTEVLVFLSIFAGIIALMKLFERQFAVLRALGASRLYVFATVWSFAGLVIVGGAVLGLLVGVAAAQVLAVFASQWSGVALSASITLDELWLAAVGALAGLLLATIPAVALYYRGSVARLLS
ncbi:MAG: ABC transporter permease [Bauldia sp.]